MLTRSFRTVLFVAAGLPLLVSGLQSTATAQNPVIDEWRSGSAQYDPFGDHLYIDRARVRVRESALDPHRHHVDRGSKHYVDRYYRDSSGRLVHEYGWRWTSHGVPHGKLTRVRVRQYPGRGHWRTAGGITHRDSDTVIYSRGGRRGGTTHRDSDTVIYSQGGRRPAAGGVTERERDTVIYSQGGKSGNNRRPGRPDSFGSIGGQVSRQLGSRFSR